jgi:hypothetical protein
MMVVAYKQKTAHMGGVSILCNSCKKRMPLITLFFFSLSLGENPFFASFLIKKTYKDHSRGFLFLTAGKAGVGVLFSFSSIPIIATFTTLLHFTPR